MFLHTIILHYDNFVSLRFGFSKLFSREIFFFDIFVSRHSLFAYHLTNTTESNTECMEFIHQAATPSNPFLKSATSTLQPDYVTPITQIQRYWLVQIDIALYKILHYKIRHFDVIGTPTNKPKYKYQW